jgi:MFS family permease
MTLFGSAANDACFNSWLTDTTDTTNRGRVEGINAMMPLIAILIVFGLLSGYATEGKWHIMFIILAVLTISAGILGMFTIKDVPLEVKKDSHYFKDIFYGFRPSSIKNNKSLYAILILFAIFGIGIQTFMTFLVQYYDATIEGTFLGFDKYVIIMAPAIILASVFTFFYGRLYDKIGFFKSILGSLAILIVGLFMLFIFKNPNDQLIPVFIGSLLMMSGWLGSNAIFGAKIRDLTPQGKVGLFQGIRIIAQVLIPMLVGPWLGAVSLSGNFTYDENVLTGGYSYPLNSNIFLAAGIVMILTLGSIVLVDYFFLKDKHHENN